jgi:two-component system invasion response regulator UvrY
MRRKILINVLLVDDHELVRTGISRIIDDVRGMKVIGEAESGEDAVKWCRSNHPDVILMDINMPGIGGLDAMHRILRINEDIKIIMLTMHTENPFPSKVMQAGAVGYLSKSAAPDEVLAAIRAVNAGQRYLAPEIAQQMALSQISPVSDDPFSVLSERELQIMMMITKGQRVVDISEQLSLSPKTINSYRYRLFDKLGVNGDVELTHLAIRYGMLDADTL